MKVAIVIQESFQSMLCRRASAVASGPFSSRARWCVTVRRSMSQLRLREHSNNTSETPPNLSPLAVFPVSVTLAGEGRRPLATPLLAFVRISAPSAVHFDEAA